MRLVAALVLLMVVASVLAARRGSPRQGASSGSRPPGEERDMEAPSPRVGLGGDLRRWVEAGLLSEDQATGIRAWETAGRPEVAPPPAAPRPRRTPAMAEGLGYLGGLLAVIGLVLVVTRYWPDMATAGRLALSAGGAFVLLAAGALVPASGGGSDPALRRARGFLWLASAAATAVFAVVLAGDALGAGSRKTLVLAGAGAVALHGGALWRRRPRPLQQLACLAGTAVAGAAGASAFVDPGPVGVVTVALGAGLLFLGLRRYTPLPLVTEGVGALAVVAGATMAASYWEGTGLLLAVAAALGLLSLALVPRCVPTRAEQLETGLIGAFLLLQAVPGTLAYYAREGGVATGLITWAAGAVVLAVGTRRLVRVPVAAEGLGVAAVLGGAALTGAQSPGFAPIFGIATAIALLALGTLTGSVVASAAGSAGLLVNVPWVIGHYFPGEAGAPLLIMASGALIIAVAVLLTRAPKRPRQGPRALPGRA